MRFRPAALAAAVVLGATVLAASGLGPGSTASARATVEWAPVEAATIHPGMSTSAAGAACTANFVFTDKTGAVYLGQAAHCTSPDGNPLSGNGCETPSAPLGTRVTLGDSRVTGTLAYSSWAAMRKAGETDPVICRANDFALVRIPPEAVAMVNPSVPLFGGPVGVANEAPPVGDRVFGYGSSDLRGGIETPQQGFVLSSEDPGWYHVVYLLPPGVPGDSGGGLIDGQGRAFGVLISLNTLPPGSNGATDLGRALAYAQKHSGIKGLTLVPGTEAFGS